jgi:carboxypeptidase C (cathepsin A)
MILGLIAAALLGQALGDYCTKNEHSVDLTALPYAASGLHECQYAGAIHVSYDEASKAKGHNLFYWFFKNKNESAPLLLWINGGPGATSMMGVFMEGGPLRARRKTSGDDDFEIYPSPKAWTDDYSVIFLDQPVKTGFSYSEANDTVHHMETGAKEFVDFLTQFLDKYPEYWNKRFFLTGESFGGKYLALFTHMILEQNKVQNKKIPLEGTLIFDPMPSPVIQRTETHIAPRGLGILDDANMDQLSVMEQRCFAE